MSIDISAISKNKKKSSIKGKKFTFKATTKKEISFANSFGSKDKMHFYKEFRSLLYAGVDFKKALEILSEQQRKNSIRELLNNITKEVVKGKSLYEALKDSGKFSAYEYYSIKIGEESRNLGPILKELATYFERKIQMRRQIISVFTYPAFVLLLTFSVLFFMMKFVVPMFSNVFRQFDRELPYITQKIIAISENFGLYSFFFFFIIAGLIGAHFYWKDHLKYRELSARIILRLPFIGNLIKKIYLTRFSQSLSLLLKAKTPLVQALDLVEKMIGFYPIEYSLHHSVNDIKKGVLFSSALAQYDIYDKKMISLIQVAEHTNTLDEMFERIAIQYDEETQHHTRMIGVIMEPLLILIIGAVVGLVLIAMYSPMFDLSKILQTK